jgi:hypothetical protein
MPRRRAASRGPSAPLSLQLPEPVLACIVYWQAREIYRVLSQCDPVANGIDLSLLERVSLIEWDNVVLYGLYPHRKLVRRCHPQKGPL